MPTAVQDAAPSISRIYAAFDDDCYRVFRRAMARSRGGVVCVEDLLAALAEALPECTAAVLGLDAPAVARLARPLAGGQDLLPMVNEPALRSVLADAHVQAAGQPITPALLLRAVARFVPPMRPLCRGGVPSSARPRPAQPAPRSPLTADTIEAILRRWLQIQSWPATSRDSALQQMANLSPPRLESDASVDQHSAPETTSDAPRD